MVAGLSRALAKLERRKKVVLAGVVGLPELKIRQRPAVGGWSRLEVLDHVVKTEESILAEVRKNQGLGKAISSRMKGRLVLLVMQLPTRIKVPKGVEFVLPDAGVEFEEIVQRWDAVRIELREYLDRVEPGQSRLGSFEHPVGGWMDVPMMLGFLGAHLRHHQYQLARLNNI